MRFTIGAAAGALLLSGAVLGSTVPAFAGADDGNVKAFWNAQSAPQAADQNGQYRASYQHYMTMDPRDAKADPNASQNVDGSNVYFNHAKGTMTAD